MSKRGISPSQVDNTITKEESFDYVQTERGGTYTPYEQSGHFSVAIKTADDSKFIFVTNPNNPNSFGQHNYIPGESIGR